MKTQQKSNQAEMNIDYLGNQGQQGGGERAQGGQQGGQDSSFGGGISQGGGERAQGGGSGGDDGSVEVEYLGNQAGLGGQVVGQAVKSDDDDDLIGE